MNHIPYSHIVVTKNFSQMWHTLVPIAIAPLGQWEGGIPYHGASNALQWRQNQYHPARGRLSSLPNRDGGKSPQGEQNICGNEGCGKKQQGFRLDWTGQNCVWQKVSTVSTVFAFNAFPKMFTSFLARALNPATWPCLNKKRVSGADKTRCSPWWRWMNICFFLSHSMG